MPSKRAKPSPPAPLSARLLAGLLRFLALVAVAGALLVAAVLVSGRLAERAQPAASDPPLPWWLVALLVLLALSPAELLRRLARRVERGPRRTPSPRASRAAEAPARSTPPAPPLTTDARWLAPGEELELHGRIVRGGMLYVGASLPSAADPRAMEPALVDPRLSAAPPGAGATGGRYGASYAALSPTDRAAFLDWLAGGRRDPRAPAGAVLLFLAGLERRVLLDAEHEHVPPAELRAIAGELARLAGVYGEDRALRAAADSLLDYVCVRHLAEDDVPAPLERSTRGLPVRLRLTLGRCVERGAPLPPALARAWLEHADGRELPAAARRAPEEFEALFRRRYPADFGADLASRRARAELTVTHRPTSSGFGGASSSASVELPDVTRWRRPLEELEALARGCGEELAGYARWRGRHPGERPDLAALSHLPAELLEARDDPPLEALRARVARALRQGPIALVEAHELLRDWPLEPGARPTKRDCAELARLLGRLGAGLEPDVRFGGARLERDRRCALFAASEPSHHAPSPGWAAATCVLHLAAYLAAADGDAGPDERAQLEAWIEGGPALPTAERERLRAHLALLLDAPVELKGLKRRVRALHGAQRAETGRLLVQLACADGRVEPEEVRALERVYALLELDPAGVHRDLHGSNVTDEPVRVRPAREDAGERAIPSPPEERDGVQLDGALVRRKLAETARVSALLSDIFESDGDEDEGEAPAASAAESRPLVGGLDAAHSALFRQLVTRPSWPRDELDELARAHGLMAAGALDTLNDEAFSRCDAPLWEGDDRIEIDPATAEEMTR